jgi:hypothetical protein
MARNHILIALGTACFALLVIFQLASTFGFPQISFLNLHSVSFGTGSSNQIPIGTELPELPNDLASQNGSLYMLGVGKADITGYVDD